MNNFTFYSPTFFAFGDGEEKNTGALVRRFGGARVLLVYGGGSVKRNGAYDAVTASLLLTEMAAWYHAQGMTLFDALRSLYEKYGWYGEKTHNLVMSGLDGLEKMAALMQSLRAQPPVEIGGVKVAQYKDYSDGTVRDAATGAVTPMPLSGSNVLRFELTDGSHIVVRPSGTEPKIKVYILTKGADAAERDANLEKYSAWVKTLA